MLTTFVSRAATALLVGSSMVAAIELNIDDPGVPSCTSNSSRLLR
jgi:hypothetical protein